MAVATRARFRRRTIGKSAPPAGAFSPDAEQATGSVRWFERTPVALVLLTVVLGGLTLAKHPGGYLSTDTGPKVATVEALADGSSDRPAIGYWAADADPDGTLHPFGHNLLPLETGGDPAYVVVTTLPMLYAAEPLYAAGGLRAALLLPVLGAVATAAAAGALARRLGSQTGAAATWIVGLASPATIYALDFWEHSPGLALMGWGVVAAVDAHCDRGSPRALLAALAAGLAFGLAASLRQEALIYAVVTVLVSAGSTLWPLVANRSVRHRPLSLLGRTALVGAAFTSGLATVVIATAVTEASLIGETARVQRGVNTLNAGGDSVADRALAALTTVAAPGTGSVAVVLVYATWFLVALAGFGFAVSRDRAARPFVIAAGCAYLVVAVNWLVYGPAFLSGLVVVAPLAGIALGLNLDDTMSRAVRVIAVAAVPLVAMFQYVQGAGPQWGGRYLLTTGFCLIVVAVVGLERRTDGRPLAVAGLLSLLLSIGGVAWTIERSRAFGGAGEELAAIDTPLVFTDPFLPQEFGPVALERKWLVALGPLERSTAVELLAAKGEATFGVVEVAASSRQPEFAGATRTDGSELVPLIGSDELRITTYVVDR